MIIFDCLLCSKISELNELLILIDDLGHLVVVFTVFPISAHLYLRIDPLQDFLLLCDHGFKSEFLREKRLKFLDALADLAWNAWVLKWSQDQIAHRLLDKVVVVRDWADATIFVVLCEELYWQLLNHVIEDGDQSEIEISSADHGLSTAA